MATVFAGIPLNLLVYKPTQTTTALCWQVNLEPAVTLDTLDFIVQVDVVPTFDSINLKEYTKDNIVNYQNGTFFKSFVLNDPVLFENQTYYWRVKVYKEYTNSQNQTETIESYWSDIKLYDTSEFLDNLEYNKTVKAYYNNSTEYIEIQKVYQTLYQFNNVMYTETELIEEIHTLYGNNATIALNELEYDKEITVKVNLFDDTTTPPTITPTENSIVIKMVHQAYFSGGPVENPVDKQQFMEEIRNLPYGINDEIYIYVGPYEFDINKITWYDDTELAERLLPDRYVYTKVGNTNIKRILEMYMRLIGALKNETVQLANDYNYKKIQDEDLYDMLGVLLNYIRNTEQPFITYKYELLNLWQAYLKQGTIEAFNILFQTLYGVKPQIEILKDVIDDKWTVFEQMPLLRIDGITPANQTISKGDAFYNSDIDKVIIATKGSTIGNWEDAYEQNPNEMTTYQAYPPKFLCFTALATNSTISLNVNGTPTFNLKYSFTGINDWKNFNVNDTIILQNIGDKVYFKGNYRNQSYANYLNFILIGSLKVSGNLYSILDEINFENITDLSNYGEYLFYNLFYSNSASSINALVNAEELEINAITLTRSCYQELFAYCSALRAVPQLPSTNLARSCYEEMFFWCSSITKAPELPAKTLIEDCYNNMFYKCSSLNEIKISYTGNFDTNYFYHWIEGVSANGTIYYNGSDTTTGDSAIPNGWTIQPFNEINIVDNLMNNLSLTNYFYDGLSQSFYEGIPEVKRYYVDYIDETQTPWQTPTITNTTPFLYTNQYLAHNIVITINNYYNINIDKKILMQIINNLKPLNVNVTVIINDMAVEYRYGLIGHYGNPHYYWGNYIN